MDKIQVLDLIRRNDNLLSLPQVLSEVLQEVGKENVSSESLSRIILKDPSLTGRVLSLSNTSFYHRQTEITTVQQAIMVMGVTTVKCLALSTSVFHPDKIARETGIDPKEYFSYVLSVASAAKRVAQAAECKATEEAFIAGLLHDVGLMFFLHHYPEEYRKVLAQKAKGISLCEAETGVFGISHSEVSYHIAEAWRLPDPIRIAVGSHHKPVSTLDGDSLSDIVRLAVALTKDRFSGFELSLEDRLQDITDLTTRLGLSKEQVDEISSSLLKDTFEIAEYLGVDIGNIEEMLTTANQEIWNTYLLIENLFKERQELSRNLLEQERARGAIEAKNVAMATLSHYLNNAVMAIYGRSQIMSMFLDKNEQDKLILQMPGSIETINRSVKKIVAVLEEMKSISPIDQKEYYNLSKAMNIDDRVATRLSKMTDDKHWDELAEAVPQD